MNTNMRDAQKQYLEYVDLMKDGQKPVGRQGRLDQ